jgi:DNA-binding transcriptional regulator YdaS (Cro superfamily)
MIYYAAKRNNHISFGSRSKIAKLIGVHSETIKRWVKAKKEVVYKNGFEFYLNTEKL